MDIITNDITNKSHLRNFYFSHILVQQRFLRPHMYIESGISVGNYYLGDSSTVHTPLKFALPFGFGFSFYISKKVFIDLSFITYYQRGVLPNDFYRVGLGYNFNTIHIEN